MIEKADQTVIRSVGWFEPSILASCTPPHLHSEIQARSLGIRRWCKHRKSLIIFRIDQFSIHTDTWMPSSRKTGSECIEWNDLISQDAWMQATCTSICGLLYVAYGLHTPFTILQADIIFKLILSASIGVRVDDVTVVCTVRNLPNKKAVNKAICEMPFSLIGHRG